MSLLRIGFDFDNVMVKSALPKAQYTKLLFKKDIPPAIFRKRLLVDSHKILSDEQYENLRRIIYDNIKTAHWLEPVERSIRVVKTLLEEGHFVAIITSHEGLGLDIAKKFLAIYRIPINCIGVEYNNTKLEAAKELRLDVFMDDDPHKLMALAETVPFLFLFDWIYNRYIKIETNLIERIGAERHGWEIFYECIHEIEYVIQAYCDNYKVSAPPDYTELARWSEDTAVGRRAVDQSIIVAREKSSRLKPDY